MNARQAAEPAPARAGDQHSRRGVLLGIAAYGLWGVLPLYFKALAGVSAVDIVAHRILWSLPFLALLTTLTRGWDKVRAAFARPQTLGILALTALLIAANWLLYVYAVTHGHILAASFGYYLNPLANVLLGRFVLGERLNRLKWTAVAIAAAGISVLAAGAAGQLWISLSLCASFALYGLLRKVVSADAVTGLAVETGLLFPLAAGWLAWRIAAGAPSFGSTQVETGLLVLAGIVSTTPLLLFTAAARKLAYSTLGMLQFLAPTLQFLIGVYYGEPFTIAHAIAFPAIWIALALYVTALLRAPRLPQAPE
ncbi:MAG: chloramphenicol-sensitive protein RarD [Sphingomonadales bacterium]|nr:chloramphenicol-sensitive protein RarD [Sphingomonadales bacterium]